MKKMKKIASVMLAMVMAMAMTIPVFATDEVGGTVTVTPDKPASIQINNASKGETYTVYKIFNATYSGGENGSIAYTYNGEGGLPDEVTIEKDGENQTLINTFFEEDAKGNISSKIGDGALSEDAITYLKALASESNKIGEYESNGSSLTIAGLDYGYYLVVSTLNGGAAVAVNSTNPTAVMNDKNVTNPTWDTDAKKIVTSDDTTTDKSSAAIGDEVTFQLSIKAQNYAIVSGSNKQIKEYVINDNYIAAHFDFVKIDSIKVGNTPIEINDCELDTTTTAGAFKLTIPWATENPANSGTYENKYKAGDTLIVKYTLKLKDTAVIAGNGNVNSATFSWNYTDGTEGPTPDPTTDTKTATVYTYALAINKVNDKDATLSGAKFKIKNAENKVIKVAATKDASGNYVYSTAEGSIEEVETDTNGLIVIKGVPAGTYTIEETKAPEGYNKLTENKTVTATLEGSYTTTITYYRDGAGKITDTITENVYKNENANISVAGITIENKSGSLLPSTGGIGTTIFYIVGGILVVGAAVLLITKKRMSKEV